MKLRRAVAMGGELDATEHGARELGVFLSDSPPTPQSGGEEQGEGVFESIFIGTPWPWHLAALGVFIFSLLLFTFYLLGSPALAEELLSLKAMVEEARQKNPDIQALREKISARKARAATEGYLDDPTLKIELEDLSKEKPFNISPSKAMQTRYTISQMFPFPGKLSLKKAIALKEVLMAEAELRDKELETVAMVKDVYYDYALMAETIKRLEQIKDILLYMAEIAQVKYGLGQASQQDVIKVQVESTMLTNEIIMQESEKGVAGAKLKSLLNRTQDTSIGEPGEVKRGKIPINVEELINKAIVKNPAIKAMEFETQANELSVDLAKKNYYPDFMVSFAPIQREERLENFDLMLQVNIPIWWDKYSHQTKEALANVDVLRSKLKAEKNSKSFEVKSAAIKVESADRIRTLYETSLIPQVELSFESALKNYQTGKVDFLTLLDAQRALRKTRIEYLNALVDYRKKIALLERVVGEDLEAEEKK